MKDKDYEQRATAIIMNTIEGVKAQIRKAYNKGYKDGKADTPFTDTEEAEEKAYNRGLNDAWDAAKKIHDGQISYEVFGLDKTGNGLSYASPLNWGETITAQEVIAKIKAYEDKQKQDAEIKVGDEVRGIDSGKRAVILGKKYGLYRALTFDGIIHEGTEEAFTKTGRTFPQIIEVLTKIKEGENIND
jgi:hypothetical protein